MSLLLGCIADDITGASDLGLMLKSNGLPTTLFLGTPGPGREIRTPAAVIALKIRTCTSKEAIAAAGRAARWLLARNARQLFYKYCSTFDSTSSGNIGPVTDALLDVLHDDFTVLLPAFPENGRTVRNGHLYVDDVPLSESSMRNHPLTPMTESFLPKLMNAQTAEGLTAWIGHDAVSAGAEALRSQLVECRDAGNRYVAIDTQTTEDLQTIAEAVADLRLVTGGSGIGGAIPHALQRRGLLELNSCETPLPQLPGHVAVLAGSCSQATRAQVAAFGGQAADFVVDPIALQNGTTNKVTLAAAAVAAAARGNVLIHSSVEPEVLRESQRRLGISASADLVEDTLAFVAQSLSDSGISKFIVAGGETSGAVAVALGVDELEIGPQIDPGVPWMISRSPKPACLAFKSGNFGRPDFFNRAMELLP